MNKNIDRQINRYRSAISLRSNKQTTLHRVDIFADYDANCGQLVSPSYPRLVVTTSQVAKPTSLLHCHAYSKSQTYNDLHSIIKPSTVESALEKVASHKELFNVL